MRSFAAPFKGVASNGSVLIGVELNGRSLELGPNSRVELSYMAVDAKGKVQDGGTDKFTLNLRPETKARVEQGGFRVLKRMNLAPGRYQVRIGTHDTSSGAVGSLIQDLEVPEFSKLPFSMSGVLLTSMSGAVIVTAKPDEETKNVLPAPPIATRSFPQNDEIALFAEIYDNQGDKPHQVDIITTVTSDTGTVVYKTEETRESKEIEGTRGGYGYATRIPLTEVTPGLYVLTVEARSRLGNQTVATRQVQFQITPRSAQP